MVRKQNITRDGKLRTKKIYFGDLHSRQNKVLRIHLPKICSFIYPYVNKLFYFYLNKLIWSYSTTSVVYLLWFFKCFYQYLEFLVMLGYSGYSPSSYICHYRIDSLYKLSNISDNNQCNFNRLNIIRIYNNLPKIL